MMPDKELLARYSGRGPRYTSYPPLPAWSDLILRSEYEESLKELAQFGNETSLYVHVPFCAQRCWYCACNVSILPNKEAAAPYLDHLCKELRTVAALLGEERKLRDVHLGGGTPNFLNSSQFAQLMETIHESFQLGETSELAIEMDPREATVTQIEDVARWGGRRISMGVQDLDPDVGKAVGRSMNFEDLEILVEAARANGINSLNFDLMYGLPKQNLSSFAETIEKVLELRPERAAIFGYAHVPWIRPQQRRLEKSGLPSPKQRVKLAAQATRMFVEAGYVSVGMDHFALPEDSLAKALQNGTLGRNFQGYTVGDSSDLIGVGASAIGHLRNIEKPLYVQNPKSPRPYLRSKSDTLLTGHRLTEGDVLRGRVISDILCGRTTSVDSKTKLWERFPTAWVALAHFESDGLVVRHSEYLEVTEMGRYFLRSIAMQFDGYIDTQAECGSRKYSAVL